MNEMEAKNMIQKCHCYAMISKYGIGDEKIAAEEKVKSIKAVLRKALEDESIGTIEKLIWSYRRIEGKSIKQIVQEFNFLYSDGYIRNVIYKTERKIIKNLIIEK